LVGVDVRSKSTTGTAEGVRPWDLCIWINAGAIFDEGKNDFESPRPGEWRGALCAFSSPVHDNLAGQWSAVSRLVSETGERHQLRPGDCKRKSQATTFVKVFLDQVLHRIRHDAHSGQGRATAASRVVSIFV
jgi:hypothetical protein